MDWIYEDQFVSELKMIIKQVITRNDKQFN